MAATKVIRIDQEVRAELQRRARPLEDTPNFVLRRLLGLPEPAPRIEPRVARLLELVQDLVGQIVQWQRDERGYVVVGRAESRIAYIRPKKEQLRVAVRKQEAEKVGLNNWESERQDGFFGGISVRWDINDGDDQAYNRLAAVLEQLWNADFATPEGV